jgi:hypothetical protein
MGSIKLFRSVLALHLRILSFYESFAGISLWCYTV